MKGFFIEITNNLLEPKHREAMGESVWLFMWLLDKITSISEDGIGKVLGGKPIIYEEVNEDLELTERTYRRWVSILKDSGYINTKRAPTGLIFFINKAKKRFGREVPKMAHQKIDSDVPKMEERCAKNGSSDVPKISYPNKTDTVDSNKDNNNGRQITPKDEMKLFIGSEEYFNRIVEYLEKKGLNKEFVIKELTKFKNYWTELNGSGKKQRWEMEKVFQLKRRLSTWLSNTNKFSKGSISKGKTIYNTLKN